MKAVADVSESRLDLTNLFRKLLGGQNISDNEFQHCNKIMECKEDQLSIDERALLGAFHYCRVSEYRIKGKILNEKEDAFVKKSLDIVIRLWQAVNKNFAQFTLDDKFTHFKLLNELARCYVDIKNFRNAESILKLKAFNKPEAQEAKVALKEIIRDAKVMLAAGAAAASGASAVEVIKNPQASKQKKRARDLDVDASQPKVARVVDTAPSLPFLIFNAKFKDIKLKFNSGALELAKNGLYKEAVAAVCDLIKYCPQEDKYHPIINELTLYKSIWTINISKRLEVMSEENKMLLTPSQSDLLSFVGSCAYIFQELNVMTPSEFKKKNQLFVQLVKQRSSSIISQLSPDMKKYDNLLKEVPIDELDLRDCALMGVIYYRKLFFANQTSEDDKNYLQQKCKQYLVNIYINYNLFQWKEQYPLSTLKLSIKNLFTRFKDQEDVKFLQDGFKGNTRHKKYIKSLIDTVQKPTQQDESAMEVEAQPEAVAGDMEVEAQPEAVAGNMDIAEQPEAVARNMDAIFRGLLDDPFCLPSEDVFAALTGKNAPTDSGLPSSSISGQQNSVDPINVNPPLSRLDIANSQRILQSSLASQWMEFKY